MFMYGIIYLLNNLFSHKFNINSIECIFTQDSKTYIAYKDKRIYQIKENSFFLLMTL